MMDFKKLIRDIDQAQRKTLVSIEDFRKKEFCKTLPVQSRGLYWLWTNLEIDDLKDSVEPHENKEIPIRDLIDRRADLSCISKETIEGYRVVYNGIGGSRTPEKHSGLRKRILQEITANGKNTGTLNMSRVSNVNNWAVSFFNFDDNKNAEILGGLKSKDVYLKYANELETIWRLEFGIPILCRL